jgi:hypothetical protein
MGDFKKANTALNLAETLLVGSFSRLTCHKRGFLRSIVIFKIELLRWGHLHQVMTNFILDKAKFAVACGRFDENFNAIKN